MINVNEIFVQNIKDGSLRKKLPEVYELQNVFENNPWHYETTFEHTLKAMEKYQEILSKYSFDFLEDTVNKYKKRDLFRIVLLLHDIAKKETIVIENNRQTSFPNHEIKGGLKSKTILEKFKLGQKEKTYICLIISNHKYPHNILGDRENCDARLNALSLDLKDIYKELLLFGMVDTMGSKLKSKNEEEYKFRIDKYKKLLNLK